MKAGHIERHSLEELWALLALFLSKLFDQVGCSEWSADVGSFNFGCGEQELEDWCLVAPPPPPSPPPPTLVSDAQANAVETLGFATDPLGFVQ